MSVEKYVVAGSVTTLLSTALNSLGNNGLVASSTFNNAQGSTGDGYTLCQIEAFVGFGSVTNAGSGISVWFLSTIDGSFFEDGSSSITPARMPDVTFPIRSVSGAQRITRRVSLPPGSFAVLFKNDATGQSMGTGNTLRILPVTSQGV